MIIIPADSPRPDLCKTMMSAIALGYPMPVIVNWGIDWHDTFGEMGGSHLSKVTGTLAYLDELSSASAHENDRLRDDDLIMTIDAYDLWFQLPPEVLLRRYHAANAAANERLAKQWGRSDLPMEQTIMLSTQKKCYPPPETGSNLHCDAIPESPLRKDLYGPNTDMDPAKNPNEFHDVRPRFLNSGTIIGPVGDMKRYFRRVLSKMTEMLATSDVRIYSDQGIFGEIFGEQEIYRQWQGERPKIFAKGDEEAVGIMARDYEYHVGLDYLQNLALTTAFAEKDGDFVLLSNHSGLDDHASELDIRPTRLTDVPGDMQDAKHPLAETLGLESETNDWGNSPLYADFYTTSVPALLHHNAHKDGMKERRNWWWDRTWFFPHLRKLMLAAVHQTSDLRPLADLAADGGRLVYWPLPADKEHRLPRLFKPGASADGLGTADFDALCKAEDGAERAWYDEVFRDGQGPL